MTNKGKMIEAIYAACLTKRATLVIFYLINRADQELTCFPSVGTIAKECNISTRTVQRALNDLEEAGFLERESRFHDKGGQRSNLYKIKEIENMRIEVETVDFSNVVENLSTLKSTSQVLDNETCEMKGEKQKSVKSFLVTMLNSITKTIVNIKNKLLSWGGCH